MLREFSADKAAKDEAKLLKTSRDSKPTPPPATPAAKTPAPVAKPAAEPEIVSTQTTEVEPEKIITRSEEVQGPKILGKIDIGGKKPKTEEPKEIPAEPVEVIKAAEPEVIAASIPAVESHKETEATVAKPTAPVEIPAVVEAKAPEAIAPAPKEIIEVAAIADTTESHEDDVEKIDTKFEVLSGPKVLGKINLPTIAPTGVKSLAGEARDDLREKRKRKRKAAGTEKVAVQERVKQDQRATTPGDATKPAPKAEITKEAVQQKVRNTMGQMGNAGKSRGMKQKIKARNKEVRANDRRETNLRKEKESK
ncbi:MAG: translation initiation factor, partial [Bacteroidota bacterium]